MKTVLFVTSQTKL